MGYFTGLQYWELGYIREFLECRHGSIEDIVDKLFTCAYASVANVVIFQMQDVLKVGNIGRMNLPSSNCLVRSTERFDDKRINTNR